MSSVAVTDTHGLIWAATGQHRRLGRKARRFFEQAELGAATIYVPTFALVEVGEATRLGTLRGITGFEAWVRALRGSGRYVVVDLTAEILLRAQSLFAIPERGDRLIAATASALDCPLLTRDPEIGRAAEIEIIG